MTLPTLDERQRRILKLVVESHVRRGEPVGSRYVRTAYHLSISPATIRGAMQRLEEEALLAHPHTSAGRIPTESGYRYYVDSLMRPEPVSPATRRAVDRSIERAVRTAAGAEDLQILATRVLAQTSHQLALVAMRAWDERPIRCFDLVALPDGLVLLAVGERGARVVTSTWRPTRPYPARTARRAERWIAERLPLRDAAACWALGRAARHEAPATVAALAADALDRAAKLLEALRRPAVRIDGAENIAAQPEFQSPDRLRGLVALLAEPEPLTRALESFMDAGGARVTIGRENGDGAMGSCSLIGTGLASGHFRGAIGVLGPVRMPYRRLVPLVSHVGRRLAEAR
ncbi:MAG: heat-inducible transcription repressor HrcA [Candidatus Latescibacteria bacterium]|nr:heat-inducible transcription repressor HrcA [Candidatus Latescibacterota bacterium]